MKLMRKDGKLNKKQKKELIVNSKKSSKNS